MSKLALQSPSEVLTINIDVENSGPVKGKETVILYLNDEFGSTSRPVREVKGFKKIFLNPKEKKTVSFELKDQDFSFINQFNKRVVEEGNFNVYFNNFNGSAKFYVKVA